MARGQTSTEAVRRWRARQDPEELRRKGRADRQRWLASRTPEQRRATRERENAARRARYAADPARRAKIAADNRVHLESPEARERKREYERAYYQQNRERMDAAATAWRKQHPDRSRAIGKASRTRRPDSQRNATARRRARLLGAGRVERVDRRVVLELSNGVCGICGHVVDPARFHVDHVVPLSRGGDHSYENTQAAHPTCNRRKGANG